MSDFLVKGLRIMQFSFTTVLLKHHGIITLETPKEMSCSLANGGKEWSIVSCKQERGKKFCVPHLKKNCIHCVLDYVSKHFKDFFFFCVCEYSLKL